MLYHVCGVPQTPRRSGAARAGQPPDAPASPRDASALNSQQVADIAASFQAAVIDVLRIKLHRAVKLTGARTIVIGGGVSANSALRAAAAELASSLHCTLRLPALQYCVDNAAMIAGLGYHYYRLGRTSDLDLEAQATVRR